MKNKNPHNFKKYEEILLKEVGAVLRRDFNDPNFAMMTLTHMDLSKDYSHAKVYWDTFDRDLKPSLQSRLGKIESMVRKRLSQNLSFRTVPAIKFVYNSQFEDEQKITKLLQD